MLYIVCSIKPLQVHFAFNPFNDSWNKVFFYSVVYHVTVSYASLLISFNSICFSVIFFLIYLLSHNVSRTIRQALILLCEIHFALLYVLQINLISAALEKKGSVTMEVVMQLGMGVFCLFVLLVL